MQSTNSILINKPKNKLSRGYKKYSSVNTSEIYQTVENKIDILTSTKETEVKALSLKDDWVSFLHLNYSVMHIKISLD